MKKVIILISILFISTHAWAKPPTLVLDMRNAPQLPKNFRSTSDHLPENINKTGLADLHIAGSAQFSKSALSAIKNQLHTKQFTVIDLRQEAHGMLNSNAVSWYGWRNAENTRKTPEQIEKEQTALLQKLGEETVATVDNILQKSPNGQIKKVKSIEYLVHQTSSEEQLLTEMGRQYYRIYVQDFHAPADEEVDRFLEVVKHLPKNKWVYFHCRAGQGRTTLFMTMYDMLRNAKTVSFEDILARQAALGGKDLALLPAKNDFKYKSSTERLDFIKKFYQYAQENQDRYQTTWSEWIQK